MDRRLLALLWNPETRRPRSPVRLAAAAAVLALLGVAAVAVAPLLRAVIETAAGLFAPGLEPAAAAVSLAFVATQVTVYAGGVYLVGRFVDRRRFRDFGLDVDRDWWVDLGFGLALGAALMTGIFLVESAAGWVVVTGTFRTARASSPFWPGFAWGLLAFLAIGATEELLARGYLLTNLAEGLTWFDRIDRRGAVALAVLGSSVAFGLAHGSNPNASLASSAGILVGGVMLAAGFVLTGRLGVPVGLHVSWNVFQGMVYGFPVSGVDVGVSLLSISRRGPPAVTGGPFGPEAGAVGVLASLVGVGLIAAWARRREGRLRVHPSITTPWRRGGDDG